MWANIPKPIEERAPLKVLSEAKKLFTKWGLPGETLWVDPDSSTLSYVKKPVISAKVEDLTLNVSFESGWEEYVQGEEWDALIRDATWGLNKKKQATEKGKGKGKGKSKGQSEE